MTNFLEKLLGRKPVDESSVQTAPLKSEIVEEKTVPIPLPIYPSQYLIGCGQSVGKQRDHNEDSLFAFNTVLAGEEDNLPIGLFIIADGMGGHQHGEVASKVAIRSMADLLMQKLVMPNIVLQPEEQEGSVQEYMRTGVELAQAAVVKEVPGGGTTLTAAFSMGDQVTIAHVGDSRAYFITMDKQIQVLTRDHSLVRRLQELGQLTDKEAAVHPQRNVLYRAIGQAEPFEPDINTHQFPRPGYLLICSDGLWGVIDDPAILKIVVNSTCLAQACKELVDAANDAGGPDNISAILVKYPL